MTWDYVQQLIRIVLQLGSGMLVSRGIINEEIASQLIGGGLSLAMVVWWVFWNQHRPEVETTVVTTTEKI